MKPFLIIICIALSVGANAQIGGAFKKLKNKVNQRLDTRVDEKIDKTLDDLESGKPANSPDGKNTDETTDTAAPSGSADKEDGGIRSYSKFDFVPGERIVYAENFEEEAVGELPTNWNTNGSGEVVTLDRIGGKWLRLHSPCIYLTSNTKELGLNYTAEFDLILQLKNNGWMYPRFTAGFFASKDEPASGNNFLTEHNKYASVLMTMHPEDNATSRATTESFVENRTYFKSEAKTYSELKDFYGKPVHVSIQVQKFRLRMWINDTKIFDVPKALDTLYKMDQLFFMVGQTNYKDEQFGIYISNIRTATGLPDTRHKLMQEGKFSTSGILFDFNSAVIRPESYGVVKEIATVLKENASAKIKIVGHTSSDGDDKANMELSVRRAAAVKSLLVAEFGIDGENLTTEGKGETQPAADNKTKEGKQQNRRVEFIKL